MLPKIQTNIAGTSREPSSNQLEKVIYKENIINISKPDTLTLKEYLQHIRAPKYRLEKESCARYVRKAAETIYRKKYSWGDAWNMMYRNKVVSEIKDSIDIFKLMNTKKMLPGMVMGFKNPHSGNKWKKDDSRKRVKYTHVALYVGVNENFEPEFIHQEGRAIKKSTLRDLQKSEYSPVILLDELNGSK